MKNKHGNKSYISVYVDDNTPEGITKAINILRKKLSHSRILAELKLRRAYEKPSVKKRRKQRESRRRILAQERRMLKNRKRRNRNRK